MRAFADPSCGTEPARPLGASEASPADAAAPAAGRLQRSQDLGDRLACGALIAALVVGLLLALPFLASVQWPY